VTDLLNERAIVGGIAILVVAVLFAIWIRSRKSDNSVDDAVLDAVQRLSRAAPAMRSGLTEEAADQAAKHLVEMLKCVAIGVTDESGHLLSWDGGANEHYADLTGAIDVALRNGQRALIHHTNLSCAHRGRCPMRTAVIVPLIPDGQVEGTLIVVGGVNSKRLIRAADEVAQFVCIQLELAKLDESKQQLAKAEVRMLRAQISPHFLYNGNEALISVEDDGVGMDADRLFADLRDAHKSGSHVGIGNINQRMRSVFGDEYALMAETAPGAGMKVILRVPKFFPGVRPDLPKFGDEAQPKTVQQPTTT
jgi:two-component system LytT family sensor kinase